MNGKLAKEKHTFGVLETDSVSLVGCKFPLAESSGVDGAGLVGGRLRAGELGVAGVCGGGPTWKLGMGTLERSLPFFPYISSVRPNGNQ